MVSGHQVEQAALRPVVHDIKAAEQRDIIGIGDLAQDALVPIKVDHGMGMG